MQLNFGVFALHLMQVALWVVVPTALVVAGGLDKAQHWKVYLPALLLSFAVMVPAIIAAERHGKMPLVFRLAVALLLCVQVGLALQSDGAWWLALWLTLFFIAFNVLEASLPSLISRMVPGDAKGSALGVYNTTQSVGLFMGGVLGGWLYQTAGGFAVHLLCGGLALTWLLISLRMRFPPARLTAEKKS